MSDGFVYIKLTSKNLDNFYARTSILSSLKDSLSFFSGNILDIGCGKMPYKKFILENSLVTKYTGLDIESAVVYDEYVKPDVVWDGNTMPFESNSFDCAFGTEVLEHCPNPELVLKEVYRVLRPGGHIFLTVPFLWNLHEVPNDEYRFTPFSLKRHIKTCGFCEIQIKPLGGWHASMAQMIGLWVRRGPFSLRTKNWLSVLAKPFVKYLIKKSANENVTFKERQMITGISVLAKKPL